MIIWVQVHTDAGIVGLGETFYAPSVVETAVHDWFGPLLIGRDPFAVERHWEAMFRLSDHAGYGAPRCGRYPAWTSPFGT